MIMTRLNANLNNPLKNKNNLLIVLILFFGIKGAIFASDTFLDWMIALFLYAFLGFLNGMKGIHSKAAKLEIVGDFFVAVVLIMTWTYLLLFYLSNSLME